MRAYRGDGSPVRDDSHTIECPLCGAWFMSILYTTEHIRQRCPATAQARKDAEMAKKAATAPRKPTNTTNKARTPAKSSRATGTQDAPAFIAADDLNGRTRFRILPAISIFQRNDGRTALFIQVENQQRHAFTWSVNCNSPDRVSLQQQIGRNILDWPGKVIELHPVTTDRGGRFVNIYDATRQQQRQTPDEDAPF